MFGANMSKCEGDRMLPPCAWSRARLVLVLGGQDLLHGGVVGGGSRRGIRNRHGGYRERERGNTGITGDKEGCSRMQKWNDRTRKITERGTKGEKCRERFSI